MPGYLKRSLLLAALILWPAALLLCGSAAAPAAAPAAVAFPSVPEVLGGRTFATQTDQDVFFLRAIHDRYSARWPDLLVANITLKDYLLSPEKLLRFVGELGEAMRGQNDPDACANLALITGDDAFYANTNGYHPEIIRAAAQALIKIGPAGRKALASSFTVIHYRNDAASLEDLADAIGEAGSAGTNFIGALAATAFVFSTTNGAIYPRCTATAVKQLLGLAEGPATVRAHLSSDEAFDNPGRFQAVLDGIAAAQASELATNLVALEAKVRTKLSALASSPGAYREDLQELDARIDKTLVSFELRKIIHN